MVTRHHRAKNVELRSHVETAAGPQFDRDKKRAKLSE